MADMPPIRVAVLTVSDRCSRGETVDTSGPALAAMARTRLAAEVVATACVPDAVDAIAAQLRTWTNDAPRPDLLLTTGGTGLAPRDVTPEATVAVLERRHEGLLELARRRCYEKTPRTYLSRGEAGTLGQTLILNLPGSERGATEMLEALLDILPHAIETLRGDVKDDGRPAPGTPGSPATPASEPGEERDHTRCA
ncbi:MAG: MogA/MoaB family molybdenum cofactor biosynthesis protein [Phycisphaeraceae bacterium]